MDSILKTTDGGDSWNIQNSDTHISYLKFIDENNGVGVGAGIFYTTDGGDNWTPFSAQLPVKGVAAVSLTDFDNVWVVGVGDNILKGSVGETVGIKELAHSIIPNSFTLSQNYPNPFNPSTNIDFRIASPSDGGLVTLKIYDVLGREVKTLVKEKKEPGTYEVVFKANQLSSGVYFYQLKAGNFIQTKKMVLLK